MTDKPTHPEMEYGGFWVRVGASLIDTLLMLLIVLPLMSLIYGDSYWVADTMAMGIWDVLFNYILPPVAIILFWVYRAATPGKMALRLKIVDARHGGQPSVGQLIGRYFAYYLSMLPLLLGMIWVGIDKRKQGWHDKLANTVVVRYRREPVKFQTEN